MRSGKVWAGLQGKERRWAWARHAISPPPPLSFCGNPRIAEEEAFLSNCACAGNVKRGRSPESRSRMWIVLELVLQPAIVVDIAVAVAVAAAAAVAATTRD